MGRFTPPPTDAATETRLQLPDGTYLGPGDLPMVDGIGIAHRASGDGYAIDAPYATAQRPDSLYIPDLSTFPAAGVTFPRIAEPSGNLRLLHLQAIILGTTPGAADTSNTYGLRVDGSSSGDQTLDLIDDVREHSFNGFDGQAFAASGGSSSRSTANDGEIAPFTLTADATVTQVALPFKYGARYSKRKAYLLNADRTEILAESTPIVGNPPTGDADTVELIVDTGEVHTFTESVDLEAGTQYWVGWTQMPVDGRENWNSVLFSSVSSTPAAAGDDYIGLSGIGEGFEIPFGNEDTGDGSTVLASGPAVTYPDGGINHLSFALLGPVGAVDLVGDPVLTVVTKGTPPATPTAVNIRMVYMEETP